MGYFVNVLPLRARFKPSDSFDTFLRQVKRTVLAAVEHQDYPFNLLVERLNPKATRAAKTERVCDLF